MGDVRIKEKTAKLLKVLRPFSELVNITAEENGHIIELSDFNTAAQIHIERIGLWVAKLQHLGSDVLEPGWDQTTQAIFRRVITSLWSEIDRMLSTSAFKSLPSAEDNPRAEAFYRAVKNGDYSDGLLFDQQMWIEIPDGTTPVEKRDLFKGYVDELASLKPVSPPSQTASVDFEQIRSQFSDMQPRFESLLTGLSGSMKCDCLHDHGVLLFLESHLMRESKEEGHRFRLAVSKHSPYILNPGWRECDIDVLMHRYVFRRTTALNGLGWIAAGQLIPETVQRRRPER